VPVHIAEMTGSLSNLNQVIMKGTQSYGIGGTFVIELKSQEYFDNESDGLMTCACVEIVDFYE
jgi:hypothetical protein